MGNENPLNLHVVTSEGQAYDRVLEEDSLVIGRSSKSGLAIPDPLMSREHARLFHDGGDWYVEDLGSHNGTLLKGEKIDGVRKISDGDVLGFGGSTIAVGGRETRTESHSVESTFSDRSIFKPARELVGRGKGLEPSAGAAAADSPLGRYAERLQILNEVHQALASSMALTELLDMILDRAFDHLRPEEGAIFLKGKGADYYCAATRSARKGEQPLFSRHLVGEVAEKGLAALVLDVEADDRFAGAQSLMTSGVRSLVAAPLQDGVGSLGMMVLGSRIMKREFTEEDMELLVSLAAVAALRIRNVALSEEAAERRRLEDEVTLARRIQIALLPESLPDIPGFELHAGNLPSRWVSGDLYEVTTRKDGAEFVVLLADVSGKGIAAALLTASLEALAAAPIEAGSDPQHVMERVTHLLYQRTPPEKYATALLLAVDAASGTVTYANAGHPPILVVRADGTTEWLGATGVPLGLLPEAYYKQGTLVLEPGDALVLYSDGITEAENHDQEEYGRERLGSVCVEGRGLSLKDLAKAIDRDMDAFAEGAPFADDRTLVFIRRQQVSEEKARS
jgi:sigma-B regulation protein RsbU (phosphoserine phosphatase)